MGKGGKKGAAAPHMYTCTHMPCYQIFLREVLESWTCRQIFPSSWRSVGGKVNFCLLWALEKSPFHYCSNHSVSPETCSKLTTFFLSWGFWQTPDISALLLACWVFPVKVSSFSGCSAFHCSRLCTWMACCYNLLSHIGSEVDFSPCLLRD